MTGQDARDVIAAHERVHGMRLATCKCGWEEPIRGRDVTVLHAAHQLDALTDVGFAIVKLPEQMTDRSAVCASIKDWPMWQLGDSWAAVDAEGDIEVETDSQTANVSGMSITDAMNLACVVLAAAAHAEAGEDRG